ncbi:sigma-70 family RNA polymerase sigma factor [bacterium]|nr:sigma-70 family RNA polymerase sigma factor [bacterium]
MVGLIKKGLVEIERRRARSAVPDFKLAQQVLNGDIQSFDQLTERYQDQVYRFILKHVPLEQAEDLAQETFISVYENLGQFKGDSKFSTWMYGIAINKIRNYLNRTPERRYRHDSVDILPERQSREASPLDRLEQIQQVKYLLDQLPQDLKEVIIFVSLEELSYEETAKAMNIPVGTVRSKVFRARQMMKDKANELEL